MKYFTIEEAELMIPKLSRLMKKAIRLQDDIANLTQSSSAVVEVANESGLHFFVTGDIKINTQFHKQYYQFYKTLDKIESSGVLIECLDDGCVDFPSKLNGKVVLLCWQLGENKIRYLHDSDSDEPKLIVDVDEFMI